MNWLENMRPGEAFALTMTALLLFWAIAAILFRGA